MGSTIAVNAQTNGYYISWVSADPWVRGLAQMHSIQASWGVLEQCQFRGPLASLYVKSWQVNKQQGMSVSWRKHGFTYGWKLCLLLAEWVHKSDLPQPVPDATDFNTAPEMKEIVQGLTFKTGDVA